MSNQSRRRGFTWLHAVITLAIMLILAAILVPVFQRAGESGGKHRSCQSNLKQIGLAIMMYEQDNDERLPFNASNPVSKSLPPYSKPYGWADALQYPYLRITDCYRCPTVGSANTTNRDGVQSNFIDYWYNSNLNGRLAKWMIYPQFTLLCGDGNDGHDGSDARYSRNVLPQYWIDSSHSPARRHLDGANYLFVDDHVKWFKPQDISIASPKDKRPTFAIN